MRSILGLLAGVFNVFDNFGNLFPREPVVLRTQTLNLWLSTLLRLRNWARSNKNWFIWVGILNANAHVDALRQALTMKARSPQKVMDVSDLV